MNKKIVLSLLGSMCLIGQMSAMSPSSYGTVPVKHVYYYAAGAFALVGGAVSYLVHSCDTQHRVPSEEYKAAFIKDVLETATGKVCAYFADPAQDLHRFIALYNKVVSVQKGFGFFGIPAAVLGGFCAWQRSTSNVLRQLQNQGPLEGSKNGKLNTDDMVKLINAIDTSKKYNESETLTKLIDIGKETLDKAPVAAINVSGDFPLIKEARVLESNISMLQYMDKVTDFSKAQGLSEGLKSKCKNLETTRTKKLEQYKERLETIRKDSRYNTQLKEEQLSREKEAEILRNKAEAAARLAEAQAERIKADAEYNKENRKLWDSVSGKPNKVIVHTHY